MPTEARDAELALVALVAAIENRAARKGVCAELMEDAGATIADLPGSAFGRIDPVMARFNAIAALGKVCAACGGCARGAVILPRPLPRRRPRRG